jgi:hypothetical protein
LVENSMVISGNVHTVVVRIASTDTDEVRTTFTVDDVVVVATAGPAFVTWR